MAMLDQLLKTKFDDGALLQKCLQRLEIQNGAPPMNLAGKISVEQHVTFQSHWILLVGEMGR